MSVAAYLMTSCGSEGEAPRLSVPRFICCIEDDSNRRAYLEEDLAPLARVHKRTTMYHALPRMMAEAFLIRRKEGESEELLQQRQAKENDEGRILRVWLEAKKDESLLWRASPAFLETQDEEEEEENRSAGIEVSEAYRREWLEASLFLLERLASRPLGFCWFLASHQAPAPPQPRDADAVAPVKSSSRTRTWQLWEDRKRHANFLSCRLVERREATLHACPVRPADVGHMDLYSFCRRVELWMWGAEDYARLCLSHLERGSGSEGGGAPGEEGIRALERIVNEGTGKSEAEVMELLQRRARRQAEQRAARCLWGQKGIRAYHESLASSSLVGARPPLPPLPGPQQADCHASEVSGLLHQCCQELHASGSGGGSALCGELRFRCLLEVCVVRLHLLSPRCAVTWQLLAQSLDVLAAQHQQRARQGMGGGSRKRRRQEETETPSTVGESATGADDGAVALLGAMTAYVEGVILPCLYTRDRSVESSAVVMRNTQRLVRERGVFSGKEARYGVWSSRVTAGRAEELLPLFGGSSRCVDSEAGDAVDWDVCAKAVYAMFQQVCGYDTRSCPCSPDTVHVLANDAATAAADAGEDKMAELLFTSELARERLFTSFFIRYFCTSVSNAFGRGAASEA